MRIPSGKTDQYIYFVAYDSSDHTTRKTGLSSFTVYRSRNNGTATAYTTPTVSELDAVNMPGVYALLVDEDTTIASGSDSEEYCVHITKAGMDPVTRTVELYRRDTTSGRTLDVSAGGEAGLDWGNVGSPTTSLDLSGTTISTSQAVASVSGAVGSVTGNVTGTIGGLTATALKDFFDTDSTTTYASAVDGSVVKEIASGASGAGLTSSDVTAAVWDADATGHQTQGTFGQVLGDSGSDSDSVWALANTNLDATVSSRLAGSSYTAPPSAATNAAAVWDLDATGHQTQGTFGQAIGDPGADTDTIFGLLNTNLDTTVSSRLASSSISLSGGAVTVGTNSDKTGYSLSQSFPSNFASLAITAGGAMTVGTNGDKTGYSLTSAYDPAKTASQAGDAMALTSGERNSTADAILDRSAGIETGITPRQGWRVMLAALAGKASGLATTTAIYRDTNDSKDRITATVDSNGNRSAVTLDAS